MAVLCRHTVPERSKSTVDQSFLGSELCGKALHG